MTLQVLAIVLGGHVRADILEDAMQNGYLVPDYPEGSGAETDLFLWERLPAIKNQFILNVPAADVMDARELARLLKKDATRVHQYIDAGIISPDQTIWQETIQENYFFLRTKLENYKRQFAPELIAHATPLQSLAMKMKLPERRIALALAQGRIQLERIGPVGRPFYVATPEQVARYTPRLKWAPPARLVQLPDSAQDLVNEVELGAHLQVSVASLRDMVNRQELEPAYIVGPNDRNVRYYFPKANLALYSRIYAPATLLHIYRLPALAQALNIHPKKLEGALHDGLILPQETLGSTAQPLYRMDPETIAATKKILNAQWERISMDALAKKYHKQPAGIRTAARSAGVPIRMRAFGDRNHASIRLSDEAALAAHLPPEIPPGMISLTDTCLYLKINEEKLRGLPGDFQFTIGSKGYRYYKKAALPDPKNRPAVAAWIHKLSTHVDLIPRPRSGSKDKRRTPEGSSDEPHVSTPGLWEHRFERRGRRLPEALPHQRAVHPALSSLDQAIEASRGKIFHLRAKLARIAQTTPLDYESGYLDARVVRKQKREWQEAMQAEVVQRRILKQQRDRLLRATTPSKSKPVQEKPVQLEDPVIQEFRNVDAQTIESWMYAAWKNRNRPYRPKAKEIQKLMQAPPPVHLARLRDVPGVKWVLSKALIDFVRREILKSEVKMLLFPFLLPLAALAWGESAAASSAALAAPALLRRAA